jgi:tRNA pseudouridine55 synthase
MSDDAQISFLTQLEPGVTGVVLIDKPSGPTSHDVVARVRRLTKQKRVGHAGTLDPLASGLLVVLIGREFTKLQDTFMKQAKVYEVTAQFGSVTDTYDSQGKVLESANPAQLVALTQDTVEAQLSQFRGTITQRVPLYAAVKINGQKLYETARRMGDALSTTTWRDTVSELPTRDITITELTLLDWQGAAASPTGQPTASFRVACSSGTYIRSFVHDLGQELGVGAFVTTLRRTQIGVLDVADALRI